MLICCRGTKPVCTLHEHKSTNAESAGKAALPVSIIHFLVPLHTHSSSALARLLHFSLANLIPTRLNRCWSCKFSSLILVFYSNACAASTSDLRRQRTLTATLLINVVSEISQRRRTNLHQIEGDTCRGVEKSPVVKMSRRDAKTTTQRTC